jgi:UDP-glucose 4-epimerase
MSLKDAVDLVVYAFLHGNPGEIFVQKSPASSIGDLLEAVRIITNSPDHKIDVIGTRHGEKLYESLISSEEMMMTEDLGDFFRIKPDNRDLNYSKYYDDGNKELEGLSEYNSDNTERLDIVSLVKLLRKEGFDNISAS